MFLQPIALVSFNICISVNIYIFLIQNIIFSYKIISGLERLCACTSDGALHFFITTDEEDSMEDKEDIEDINMMTAEESSNKSTIPSTSTSSAFQ